MQQSTEFAQFHVGVFDSGLGGRYVAAQLQEKLPGLRVSVLADSKNIPYGLKTAAEMLFCVKPFMTRFQEMDVDAVVMACNTCFTNLGSELKELTDRPLLGFEPALVQAAAQSRSRAIVVCATQGTLKSQRWRDMKLEQGPDCKIIDIDCTDWVTLVEADAVQDHHLKPVIEAAIANNADSLVLGCTHYHWLKEALGKLVPGDYDLKFYEPTPSIIAELKSLLLQSPQ